MRWIAPLLLSAALLAPTHAAADILTFEVTDDGELPVSFGLNPFRMTVPFDNDLFSGTLNFTSGALIRRTVDEDDGLTSYLYGSGVLTLEAFEGTFTAETDPFWVDLEEDADDLFGGALADDFDITFDSGHFDDALATFLQVLPLSGSGGFDLGLEDIDGDPDSSSRVGFDHRGSTELEIITTPAPEPSLLLLGAVAAAGWAARRRRVR